ncbi:MAG: DUF839 domain-containing protein [Chloroflexota bacterium]|jgi:hypothetical protein
MINSRKVRIWSLLAGLILLTALPALALANPGWLTPEAPYITLEPGLPTGSMVKGIISSGEVVDGVRFQGIPDGIGITGGAAPNTVDVYVAHEETTVPFFGTASFQDASVSKLTLSTVAGSGLGAVEQLSVAVSPDDGYLRFCSATMAGAAEGFDHPTFFVGEETNDIVDVPAGAPYGADPALAPQRQGGYAVALDTVTGESVPVPGLGRLNHENTAVIPGGWNQFALLTTDDTFNAPSAQLYLYLANHESHIMDDKGSLWAFRVTRTGEGPVDATDAFNEANDYLDLQVGDEWQGEFIRVPKEIARGLTEEAPQDALENWSNENNVFQFIRLEDLDYDRHNPRVVYVADTGQTRIVPDADTGRMQRGPGGTVGMADNGRIFKFVFNENNPRKVDSFSIMADGDATGTEVFVPFINPDNMGASANSLMVQEDNDNARVWQHDFASGSWQVVATVNDPDGESSGIVDASAWFGDGAWLLDVQGHGRNVLTEVVSPELTLELESGQLMLMVIPGS